MNNYELLATDNWQLTTVNCLASSTTVEKPLQISSFLANKANFPDAQMNVSHVITMEYENETLSGSGKNKANSNPNKANLRKPKMNVNKVLTKDYQNIANCKLCENKPNTKPIQTQSNPISNGVDAFPRFGYYTLYSFLIELVIENLRFETACIEKGYK